jgi:hypothetical protein
MLSIYIFSNNQKSLIGKQFAFTIHNSTHCNILIRILDLMKYEVLMAVNVKNAFSWDVTPCNFVVPVYQSAWPHTPEESSFECQT